MMLFIVMIEFLREDYKKYVWVIRACLSLYLGPSLTPIHPPPPKKNNEIE